MSSDIEAELEISIDADKFSKGSDKVQKGFNEIEKSAESASSGASDAMDDVGDSASKMGDDVKKAGDKGERAMDDMGAAAEESGRDMAAVGVSVLGLGQAIGGLSDTIFGFNEKLIALEKSAFGVEETARDLTRASEDLKTAMDDGTLAGRDLTRAIEDLDFIYRKLAIEEKEVLAEQEALNSEFINFGLTLTQTVSFGILTVNTLLSDQQKIWVRTRAAILSTRIQTVLMGNTFKTLIFDINGFSAALVRGNGSLALLKSGVRGFFTALGPIGIAIIGIGIAMEVWNSNIGGVQEKMAELWELLKKFIPLFQVLETAVNSLFPQEANAQVQEYGSSIETLTGQLAAGEITAEEFSEQIQNVSSTTQEGTEALSEYNSTLGLTNDSTDSLTKSTSSMGSAMSAVPAWYRSASSSVKQYNKDVDAAAAATKGMMDRLKEAQALKKKQDSELNTGTFEDVERKRGKLDQSTFDAILARDSGVASRFTVFGGPGRVLTAGLQRQLADNAARNARKSFIRSAEGKALAKEEKKQKQVFQIQLAGNLGLDISDFHVTGKKTDLGTFTKLSIGPKTKESLALLSGMLRDARLSEEDALFMSPGELQARISQTKEGRQLAISNDLDVSQVLSNIDSIGSVEGAAQFVNRNTFFGGQSNSLGISSGAIEESLRGADKDKLAGQFSDMLGFLNKDRLSVVRT